LGSFDYFSRGGDNMKYQENKSRTALAAVLALSVALGGCAAVHTSIAKKDLDVQTKMSDTIFLDPVEGECAECR
jgi:hypothetical protein